MYHSNDLFHCTDYESILDWFNVEILWQWIAVSIIDPIDRRRLSTIYPWMVWDENIRKIHNLISLRNTSKDYSALNQSIFDVNLTTKINTIRQPSVSWTSESLNDHVVWEEKPINISPSCSTNFDLIIEKKNWYWNRRRWKSRLFFQYLF